VPSRLGERNGPSEEPRPRLSERHLAHRGQGLVLGARDQGRKVCRHTGLEQRVTRTPIGRGVGIKEVDAAEAVHLEVDETGSGDSPAVRARQAVANDRAVPHLDVAVDEQPVDECRLDVEFHPAPSSIGPV
jgi:hypothetical protein